MASYCARKKRLFLVGILLVSIMFISGIYALNKEIIIIETGISTGTVDLEIKEYGDNDQPFNKDGARLMPGEEITLIPRVNNLGMDCYLRAKIEYMIDGEVFPEVNYISGNYSSWTKKGNYYYYDSILSKKSYIELFDRLRIPDLSSDYNNKQAVLNIVVEAVQAKNFDGNWDKVDIKKSINRTYDIDYEGDSFIIYEDSTNDHIKFNSNFFDKLGNILPGDKIVDNITILNKSNSKNEYYLTIDHDYFTNNDLDLLEKLQLIIKKNNGEVIVNSNLGNSTTYILGVYDKGEGDKFKLEISLPKDADNTFTKLYTKIRWKFSYKDLSEESDNIIINPQTNDININLYIIVFMLSTIGLISDMILWKVYELKDEEKEKKYEKE